MKTKNIKLDCTCYQARETMYHFANIYSIAEMLVLVIRSLAKPRAEKYRSGAVDHRCTPTRTHNQYGNDTDMGTTQAMEV